jgi:hypothetical protein
MPSIFEKPSILGFRAEGGNLDTKRLESSKRVFMEAAMKKAGELGVDVTELLSNPRYAELIGSEMTKTATSPIPALSPDYGMAESSFSIPVFRQEGGRDVYWRDVASSLASETPQALTRFIQPTQPTPTATPAAPAVTPSMFGPPAPGEQIFGPPSILANQQPGGGAPGGTRAERVAAAIASGDFAEKQRQYNQEAMRLGQPTQMDAQGNIVGRELTEAERMREFFKTTGGNTMFSQTTDPAQRALQNEMMKQARAQATVNTFGTTPPERLANLQAATDARKIPQPPLSSDVREVAPGVRAAFKDGQMIGFSAPGDGSPATMNDPLKRYITNPDGSVSRNYNPPQILMSDEMKDTGVRQNIEGKTGGSPMERGLLAAMAAEEERKKKMASDAAAAALAATPPTTEAELIARTPAITIPPREKAAPKTTPPSRLTPLKDIRGSSYVDPTTGQKMIW